MFHVLAGRCSLSSPISKVRLENGALRTHMPSMYMRFDCALHPRGPTIQPLCPVSKLVDFSANAARPAPTAAPVPAPASPEVASERHSASPRFRRVEPGAGARTPPGLRGRQGYVCGANTDGGRGRALPPKVRESVRSFPHETTHCAATPPRDPHRCLSFAFLNRAGKAQFPNIVHPACQDLEGECRVGKINYHEPQRATTKRENIMHR